MKMESTVYTQLQIQVTLQTKNKYPVKKWVCTLNPLYPCHVFEILNRNMMFAPSTWTTRWKEIVAWTIMLFVSLGE